MTKLIKFSLTALCVATLTACGSGGGSSDGNKNQNVTSGESTRTTQTAQTHTTQNTTPAPNRAPSTINKNANVAGSGLKVGTVTQASVVVDGKTLSLSAPRTTFNGKRISN